MILIVNPLTLIREQHSLNYKDTLVPKNLCAITLSTIYLSPKDLGRKFEIIWAPENLGTNFGKTERFSTTFQSDIYLSSLLFIIIPVILLSIVSM